MARGERAVRVRVGLRRLVVVTQCSVRRFWWTPAIGGLVAVTFDWMSASLSHVRASVSFNCLMVMNSKVRVVFSDFGSNHSLVENSKLGAVSVAFD